jgi:PhzF family phenazine biosynthesis protein
MERHSTQRLAAFTDDPTGGNPAGVWIGDDTLPSAVEMQRIAAEIGYSETAFLAPADGATRWITRYYSPKAEVSFCGHATIAAAVALWERHGSGTYWLETSVGDVPVDVDAGPGALPRATLTSVPPAQRDCPAELLQGVLSTLGWSTSELDPALPAGLSYAGAWHLVMGVGTRATLAAMSYDFERLRGLMAAHDLTTVQIVWREDHRTFHARNPFPVGGVVEDPATGAAAAALGAYLRARDLVDVPADIVIHQGHDMGRPSRIEVHIPTDGGVLVTGGAVPVPD